MTESANMDKGLITALRKRPVLVFLLSQTEYSFPVELTVIKTNVGDDMLYAISRLYEDRLVIVDAIEDSIIVQLMDVATLLGIETFLVTDLEDMQPTPTRVMITSTMRRVSYNDVLHAQKFKDPETTESLNLDSLDDDNEPEDV